MNRKFHILTWIRHRQSRYGDHNWADWLWLTGLLLSAITLFSVQLGNLPLRDWDEGTVARVAQEIWLAPKGHMGWLFPTLWGEAYLNKPPLIHDLIAMAYYLGGVSEWTARLPGAMLTAISVPLLYSVGREIFSSRLPAIFAALIYLTLLPVVRHGRLAMLDGAVICFEILMMWCLLRTRRNGHWALGVGISFSLICLTKGIIGLLIGAIALIFIAWDTPRLLKSVYLWSGLLLGSIPAIAWYVAQWLHYNQAFINTGIVNQSFGRIWSVVENHSAPPWYYLIEILKYPWPWLLFCLLGLKQAWENPNWSWSKLVLAWSMVYLVCVSLMATKLPWYILPLYPALALAGGSKLSQIYNLPSSDDYPRYWSIFFWLISLVAGSSGFYFVLKPNSEPFLGFVMASISLTMGIAAVLLERQDRQFMPLLCWGMYISLLLFFCSPYWIWELNEAYQVKPIAREISQLPREITVYTSFDYERPSLNFYSGRQILLPPQEQLDELALQFPYFSQEQLKLEWLKLYWKKETQPFLLVPSQKLNQLNLESAVLISNPESTWKLVTKDND